MIYMLMASGISLILSMMNILNFAHGELYMLGGLGVWLICERFGYPYWLGIVGMTTFVVLLGILLERMIFRPLRGRLLPALFTSFGVGLIMQSSCSLIFGGQDRKVTSVFKDVIEFSGVFVPLEKLVIVVGSLILVGALVIFVKYSRAGQALQAVTQDHEAAALMGININRTNALGFAIGCALAGVGGGLIAPVYYVSPYMGMGPMLKACTVVIIGGLGSLPGAILGSFLLGFIDQFSLTFVGYVGNIFGFVIIMMVLLFRPQGLLGQERAMH
jgi:branched-chain amino acid transport system permease protein